MVPSLSISGLGCRRRDLAWTWRYCLSLPQTRFGAEASVWVQQEQEPWWLPSAKGKPSRLHAPSALLSPLPACGWWRAELGLTGAACHHLLSGEETANCLGGHARRPLQSLAVAPRLAWEAPHPRPLRRGRWVGSGQGAPAVLRSGLCSSKAQPLRGPPPPGARGRSTVEGTGRLSPSSQGGSS